jgi:hypothetical protein
MDVEATDVWASTIGARRERPVDRWGRKRQSGRRSIPRPSVLWLAVLRLGRCGVLRLRHVLIEPAAEAQGAAAQGAKAAWETRGFQYSRQWVS